MRYLVGEDKLQGWAVFITPSVCAVMAISLHCYILCKVASLPDCAFCKDAYVMVTQFYLATAVPCPYVTSQALVVTEHILHVLVGSGWTTS